MILEPLTCSECHSIRPLPTYTTGNMQYYCGLAPTDKRFEVFDVSSFKVDPDACPDWCPIVELNKQIAALPQEKQELISSFINVMEAIFKINMAKDKYDIN